MIKNPLARVIFRTVYVVLGLIGALHSLGYFSRAFNTDFYVYYTTLSNLICTGTMTVLLVLTIRDFHQPEPKSYAPCFKFMCVIMIMVTCLVYNFLLAGEHSVADYFLSIGNLLNHLILPIMFVVDWVLFDQHGQTRWYYPLMCLIMPLVYVVFIVIRGAIFAGQDMLLYPYFFLNLPKLGAGMFCVWIIALIAIFVAIGYALFGLDHLRQRRTAGK